MRIVGDVPNGDGIIWEFDPENRPRDQLEGLTLDSGWVVTGQASRGDDPTGSAFSCGYLVERGDQVGFLKAIDLQAAFEDMDTMMVELQKLTEKVNHEKFMLDRCAERNMDRVVVAIDHGSQKLSTGPDSVIHYFVFTKARGDVRQVHAENHFNARRTLRTLHQVAVGISQLHGSEIAHQDIKPSNVLEFEHSQSEPDSRISDLGRASSPLKAMPHDESPGAGDPNYWPPEAIYGFDAPSWQSRRACDLYQLGSLALYLFEGITASAALARYTSPEFLPPALGGTFQGDFSEALPQLRNALQLTCDSIQPIPAGKSADRVVGIIRELLEPDPALRGHPKNRTRHADKYGIGRYVTELNLAANRAWFEGDRIAA